MISIFCQWRLANSCLRLVSNDNFQKAILTKLILNRLRKEYRNSTQRYVSLHFFRWNLPSSSCKTDAIDLFSGRRILFARQRNSIEEHSCFRRWETFSLNRKFHKIFCFKVPLLLRCMPLLCSCSTSLESSKIRFLPLNVTVWTVSTMLSF